ncbi:hypothetical protein [Adhaeretor mobilis]|nr:hypothetical protein [Adhaeretor mobilis]
MSSASRPWYRLRIRTLLLLLVLVVVAWSVYTYWSDYTERHARVSRELMTPTSGTSCRVLFRGDAIGVENSGVRWGEVNGRANYVRGDFVKMNEQWLVIESEQSEKTVERWIPREQVLFIEIEK